MKLRSFIALEIPAEIQRAIRRNTAPLQKTLTKPMVRWVEPQNIHLTLKFLGDVSPEELEQLAEALKAELVTHEILHHVCRRAWERFPTLQRPRIIWVGLEAPACTCGAPAERGCLCIPDGLSSG